MIAGRKASSVRRTWAADRMLPQRLALTACLALTANLALAACGPAAPGAGDPADDQLQSGVAGSGQPHTPQTPLAPESIVSLNPCLDAILVEIAAPDQIAALSHYSRDPRSTSIEPQVAARYNYVGASAEEVLAIKPDLVLASSFLDPASLAAMERAGLRVASFGSPRNLAQSADQVREIARLTGQETAGDALITRMQAGRNPADLAGQPVSALLWQPGQIVPGEATLIGELMREAGLVSHSAQQGLEQADYVSLESVLADPPDLLLVAGDSAGQSHPLLSELEATRVEAFDPKLLFCGGPTVIAARERLNALRSAMAQPQS